MEPLVFFARCSGRSISLSCTIIKQATRCRTSRRTISTSVTATILYNALAITDPQYSMSELLIDEAKYDAWFGSGVSAADKLKNVGKRTQELAIQYLPNYILRAYCNDKAAGRTHASGSVKEAFPSYTVAQLEADHLWSNMDAKITSLGGCDHVPY